MTNSDASPSFSGFSRRSLLAGTAGAAVLTGIGALGSRMFFRNRGTQVYNVLSDREARVLEKLAVAYFPAHTAFGIDGAEAGVAGYLDNYLSALGGMERNMIRGMLLAFDQGTLLSGRWTPLHRMNNEQIQTYLQKWEQSRIAVQRDIATGLKSLLGFAYFSHPTVMQHLGIRRTCGSTGPSFLPQEAV